MAQSTPSPTISLRERPVPVASAEEPLPKWVILSLLLHVALIGALFLAPFLPTRREAMHETYTVDLIGGERIGRANFGTELTPPPKTAPLVPAAKPAVTIPDPKPVKTEKKPAAEEKKIALKEKAQPEQAKPEPVKTKTAKEIAAVQPASADSVRERLLHSAVERAKSRTDSGERLSKGEAFSAGSGEGQGAAALGSGGRGGPGIVKGIDFIIYRNRMLDTIKENWAWVGQRTNLIVVVHFGVKEDGEIAGLRIVKPSGDPSFDESVLRALKKSNPLPAPPPDYRGDFAEVEVTFRPSDLGA
jgi:colicin import membrane protein